MVSAVLRSASHVVLLPLSTSTCLWTFFASQCCLYSLLCNCHFSCFFFTFPLSLTFHFSPVQRVQFSDGLVIIKLPSVSSAARTTIEVDRSSTSLLAAPRTPEPTDNSHVADAVVRLPAGAPSGHSQVTVRLAGGPHSKSFSVGTTAAPSRDSSTSTNDARPSAVVRLPKSAAAGEWARERRAEEAAERAAAEAERAAAEAERAKEEAQRVKEEEQRAKAEAQSKAAAQWAKSSALVRL